MSTPHKRGTQNGERGTVPTSDFRLPTSLPEHPCLYGLSEDRREKRFACRCCGVNHIDIRLQAYVHCLEDAIGSPLTVNSGYRCEKHNDEVGGSKTSSHLGGLAVDIACPSSRLRFEIVDAAIRIGITRIGVYRGFVHLDIDQGKAQEVIWHG